MRPEALAKFAVGLSLILHLLVVFFSEEFLSHSFFAACASASMGWLSSVLLAGCCKRWFRTERMRAIGAASVLLAWYIPALHAYPEASSWGYSVFWVAAALWITDAQRRLGGGSRPVAPSFHVLIGALLGLGFRADVYVGLMIVGLSVWTARLARLSWGRMGCVFLGVGLAFLAGAVRTLGGESFWIETNFMSGRFFSSAPMILRECVGMAYRAMAVFTVVCFVVGLWIKPKLSLIWTLAPYLISVSIWNFAWDRIGVVFCVAPPLALLIYQEYSETISDRVWKFFVLPVAVLNFAVYVCALITPLYF